MRARSPHGEEFSRYLSNGQLKFQCCVDCDRVQYPPAEVCRQCLGSQLVWRNEIPDAKIVACVAVHRSYAEDFVDKGPWWVASVSLGPGINCYAHALRYLAAGSAVHLVALKDRLGDGVLGVVAQLAEQNELQARFN